MSQHRGRAIAAGFVCAALATYGCARGSRGGDDDGNDPPTSLGNEFPGDQGGAGSWSTGQGAADGSGSDHTSATSGPTGGPTGATTSATTGGTSGATTGAGGNPPANCSASCDACIDCAQQGACAGPVNACFDDAGCSQVFDCVDACNPADDVCYTNCVSMPGGDLYFYALDCIFCGACVVECPDDSSGCT